MFLMIKVFLMINVFQLRNQLRNQFRSQIEMHRGLRSSFDFNGFGYTKSTFKTFFDFIVSFIAPLVARCWYVHTDPLLVQLFSNFTLARISLCSPDTLPCLPWTMSLVHTNATMNATVPVKNLFLRTVLANSCDMRLQDVDVDHFFSLPEFLFSACLLVTFANAGPTFIALLVHLKRFVNYAFSRCRGRSTKSQSKKATAVPETAAESDPADGEDVGLADSRALLVANAAFDCTERVGLPECELNLAHATLFLATCPKSNSSTLALGKAKVI